MKIPALTTCIVNEAMCEPSKDDYMLFYQNLNSSDKMNPNIWTHSYDKRFRIAFFSSNNPKYNENKSGYYICQGEGTFMLVSSRYIDGKLNKICENYSIYIARSEIELNRATKLATKSLPNRYSPKLRIYTDYKRINESHFWSETIQDWWNLKNDSQSGLRKFLLYVRQDSVINSVSNDSKF